MSAKRRPGRGLGGAPKRRLTGLLGWLLAGVLALGFGPLAARAEAPSAATPGWPHQQTAHYVVEYRPELAGVATTLVARLEAHHARIYGELGLPVDQAPTRITLLGDEAAMLAEAARRHGNQRPPEWAAGLAYPASREIFLHTGVPAEELERTLQHELSHIALGALVGPGRVPTWFSEAVAIKQSEGFALERAWLLTQAATVDGLLRLDELSRGFPAGSGRAGIAYAQAVHFVGYLQQQFGQERFNALLRHLHDAPQAPFSVAFESTYGRSLATVEEAWRESLKLWWGWIPIALAAAFAWVLALVLVVSGWRRRRRAQARRLEALRAAEAEETVEDIEVVGAPRPPPNPAVVDPYSGGPPTLH